MRVRRGEADSSSYPRAAILQGPTKEEDLAAGCGEILLVTVSLSSAPSRCPRAPSGAVALLRRAARRGARAGLGAVGRLRTRATSAASAVRTRSATTEVRVVAARGLQHGAKTFAALATALVTPLLVPRAGLEEAEDAAVVALALEPPKGGLERLVRANLDLDQWDAAWTGTRSGVGRRPPYGGRFEGG